MKKLFASILFLSFILGLMFGGQSSFAATTVDPTGTRIIPTILSVQGESKVQDGNGLFDSKRPSYQYNTNEVFYWHSSSDFIELQIDNNFRIWRSGTNDWSSYAANLKLQHWNGTAYVDITATQPSLTAIKGNQWELMSTDLPAGKYKFSYLDNLRLDSEWYVEQLGELKTTTVPYLTVQAGNLQNTLTWTAVSSASGYNIKRSTTAGGPYTTVASNVTATSYSDNEVTNDLTYYYVVTAVNAGEESGNSNETSVTLSTNPTLDIVIAEDKVSVGQEVIANVALKNVTNIYAEDFTLGYDQTLFDYMGFEEVSGYKVYYKPVDPNGSLRFIVASEGQQNGITGEKTFLKLKFKAKAAGTAKVDALKCRVADIEKEFDLNGTACGEDSLVIDGMTDVNRSGEYTLLDLAIDSYYYGQSASSADPVKYAANQAGDENVTNDDLLYIVNQMLANPNYAPNK